ncbi:hypothetical protein [Occallatibacter riparius]|uniref:Uncharacterized protein n=1 Tax=Occallatibacter riparius TaxID=1002689 RepID=A0A9J7BV54_9BACT|nr:hypothetical protein [Occallatibacter riparius]UWZ86756.1 hypothetical protein MOP44_12595 [Occallatibacter riparius]
MASSSRELVHVRDTMSKHYYGRQKFEIETTGDTLKARCNLPFGPKRNCLWFCAVIVSGAAWLNYWMWFSSSSYRHSSWWYLTHGYSADHFDEAIFGTAFSILFVLLGIRLLCPAGAILSCTRSQVTTTRIPWYSFTGRWVTRTYEAIDVSGFRLKYFGSSTGRSVYGIRFYVNGRKKTIFHGSIEPPEAYRILLRLKNLGLDVPADPKLLSRVKIGLLDRKEDELDRRMRI